MAQVEQRLTALGLVLPPPVKPPPGIVLPFQFVRLVGIGHLSPVTALKMRMALLPGRLARSAVISPLNKAMLQRALQPFPFLPA